MPQFVWGSISGVRGSGGSYPRFSVPFGGGGGGGGNTFAPFTVRESSVQPWGQIQSPSLRDKVDSDIGLPMVHVSESTLERT